MIRAAGSPRDVLERQIERLHEERLRVWSIVITLFGDAVVPRGGEVWLGLVSALMDRLRINPGTLGAAMSRLTAEDWLVREKRGRKSHYRLADAGKEAFDEAAKRIYGLDRPRWTGLWSLRVVDEASPEVAAAHRRLGYGQLGPETFVRPEQTPPRPVPAGPGVTLHGAARLEGDLALLTARAFPFEAAEARNRAFLAAIRPWASALNDRPVIDPVDAFALRTLLIHGFRRVVLRDPWLPAEAVPEDSARLEARQLVGTLYRSLLPASERWLDGWAEAGLEAPDDRFYERFGGLPRTD